MNHHKEAKSLTFWRASEVSQVMGVIAVLGAIHYDEGVTTYNVVGFWVTGMSHEGMKAAKS